MIDTDSVGNNNLPKPTKAFLVSKRHFANVRSALSSSNITGLQNSQPRERVNFAMADTTPKSYSADPTLYLYTSLTAGSSHIITATSRLETILKANRIPFQALDVATDEKARMLWGRRSKGKKLPGLVKYGTIVGV
jgi:hypothetical protein